MDFINGARICDAVIYHYFIHIYIHSLLSVVEFFLVEKKNILVCRYMLTLHIHREIFSESFQFKPPNLDCSYTFAIWLAQNGLTISVCTYHLNAIPCPLTNQANLSFRLLNAGLVWLVSTVGYSVSIFLCFFFFVFIMYIYVYA